MRKDLLECMLPLVDDLAYIYPESTLRECGNEFRRVLIQYLNDSSIVKFIGKMKCKKIIGYIEDPTSKKNRENEPPYQLLAELFAFLFDKTVGFNMESGNKSDKKSDEKEEIKADIIISVNDKHNVFKMSMGSQISSQC